MEEVKTNQMNALAAGGSDILKLAAEMAKVSPKTTVMDIPLEDVLCNVGSIYKLCTLASKRAMELSEGAPKLVLCKSLKPATIALEEIREKKITYKEKAG